MRPVPPRRPSVRRERLRAGGSVEDRKAVTSIEASSGALELLPCYVQEAEREPEEACGKTRTGDGPARVESESDDDNEEGAHAQDFAGWLEFAPEISKPRVAVETVGFSPGG